MKKHLIPAALIFAIYASAENEWSCPKGSVASEKKHGNARTFACLDVEGQPHGPFEVRAYADTTATGAGTLVIRGIFDHGKQDGTWSDFNADGKLIVEKKFKNGKNVGDPDAAN